MGLISTNDETFDDPKRCHISIIEVYLTFYYLGAEAENLCRVSANKTMNNKFSNVVVVVLLN